MSLSVPVCFLVYVVNQVSQNGGSDKCARGTAASRGAGSLLHVLPQGRGGGHSSSIREVRKKDNKLPPRGPWGYKSKAVLGG